MTKQAAPPVLAGVRHARNSSSGSALVASPFVGNAHRWILHAKQIGDFPQRPLPDFPATPSSPVPQYHSIPSKLISARRQ